MQLETPGQTKAPVSPPTNSVYFEITDVSAVDPVYADIDKRESHPRPHEVPDPLPMQSQHVTTRNAGSVGGVNNKDGVDLTRNKAYGLLQNVIFQGGIYYCL